MKPLRLMVYDRTDTGPWYRPGLSHAWWAGAHLYHRLQRLDAYHSVASWEEAWGWLQSFEPHRAIAEVQYWGHGKWGDARAGRDVFGESMLLKTARDRNVLDRVVARFTPSSLWWFRTCETFGAKPGHAFASALADRFGCRVAGHTFIIGHIQSGLHSLAPGEHPTWSLDEGLREGSPESPKRAYWSHVRAPNTISCLRGSIPSDY